jgi:hypothetical protein
MGPEEGASSARVNSEAPERSAEAAELTPALDAPS